MRLPAPRVGPAGPIRAGLVTATHVRLCARTLSGLPDKLCTVVYNPRIKKSKTFDVKVAGFVEASPPSRTATYRVMTVEAQYNNIVLSVGIAVIQPNCHLLGGIV